MVFNGAGIYSIVSYQGPDNNINSWGGGTTLGQPVKLYPKNPLTSNAKWQVALINGSGESAQYLIINLANGGYLTATGKNQVTSCQFKLPTDPTVRWTIKHYKKQDRYDVYTVNSVSANGQLNAEASGTAVGTNVLSWQIENGDNTMWYFDAAS
ncbi:putative agglutinin ssa-like protein [Rosellinia necatrix]|uniref:Putative agglutinin ssa-like protein n=1 Tax=Rosellinia necatrix TaxID=77044 RepID=A0A1W2TUZ4_ROSNE|nr:putative agglutinin ssa-like protein [Rosellinia necatrix]